MQEEQGAGGHAHQLRDGEGPPHGVEDAGTAEQPGRRDEHQQLAGDGHEHTVGALSQRLEGGAGDHAEAGKDKGDADGPQGGHADGQHIGAGVEQAQEHLGDELHQGKAHQHDGHGKGDGQPDGLAHPVGAAGAVVIGDDGHHGVVQAEHRHENEALQLEINPEHRHGGGGEAVEDAVHAIGHQRADGGHDDGGHAHLQNRPDHPAHRTEAPEGEMDLGIFPEMEEHGGHGAAELAEHGGGGGAGHAHGGEAQQAEDQDGVHDDVDDGAGHLSDHGQLGPAGGLQQPLKIDGGEAEGADADADAQIGDGVLDDGGAAGLGAHKGAGGEHADEHKDHRGAQLQKQALPGGLVHHVLVVLAQRAGKQGVDAHAQAHGKGDHQVLHGKTQGDGGEGVLADLGHEDAVHHVVQGLHHHGKHHGQGHVQQQPVHRLGAHAVFGFGSGLFVHVDLPFIKTYREFVDNSTIIQIK